MHVQVAVYIDTPRSADLDLPCINACDPQVAGLGIDVTVLAGVAVFSNCLYTNQGIFSIFSGLAQSVFVGGR